jgi:hypothetical protein
MQQSCVDEDDAWELEQCLGLGSREILVVSVVEAVPLAVAVEEVRARNIVVLRRREAVRRGRCGTTMFVHKGGGFTARYTIRFRPEGA